MGDCSPLTSIFNSSRCSDCSRPLRRMIVLCLSTAFSILNVIGAIYDLNGQKMSKEDTNDKRLNNLR